MVSAGLSLVKGNQLPGDLNDQAFFESAVPHTPGLHDGERLQSGSPYEKGPRLKLGGLLFNTRRQEEDKQPRTKNPPQPKNGGSR